MIRASRPPGLDCFGPASAFAPSPTTTTRRAADRLLFPDGSSLPDETRRCPPTANLCKSLGPLLACRDLHSPQYGPWQHCQGPGTSYLRQLGRGLTQTPPWPVPISSAEACLVPTWASIKARQRVRDRSVDSNMPPALTCPSQVTVVATTRDSPPYPIAEPTS
jgi:hypothetical protein